MKVDPQGRWTETEHGLYLFQSKTLLKSALFSFHAHDMEEKLLSLFFPPPPLTTQTQHLLHPGQRGLQSPAHRHLHLGHPGKDAAV